MKGCVDTLLRNVAGMSFVLPRQNYGPEIFRVTRKYSWQNKTFSKKSKNSAILVTLVCLIFVDSFFGQENFKSFQTDFVTSIRPQASSGPGKQWNYSLVTLLKACKVTTAQKVVVRRKLSG